MAKRKTVVPFHGTAEQEKALRELIAAHKEQQGALMPVLQGAQEIYGYLPIEVQTIIAEVPLAELANFTTFIRQTTQGRGWFTTEFARYEILPEMLVPAVVEQAKKLGNLDESADD